MIDIDIDVDVDDFNNDDFVNYLWQVEFEDDCKDAHVQPSYVRNLIDGNRINRKLYYIFVILLSECKDKYGII